MHGIWLMGTGRGQRATRSRTWRTRWRGKRSNMTKQRKRRWRLREENCQNITPTRSVFDQHCLVLSSRGHFCLKWTVSSSRHCNTSLLCKSLFNRSNLCHHRLTGLGMKIKSFVISSAHAVRVAGGCTIGVGHWLANGCLSCGEKVSHCCLEGRNLSLFVLVWWMIHIRNWVYRCTN